ncbi:hypothetical protein YC2023_100064 [Brassica napus]
MYPIKARNGSVFEPDKAPSVGLTLGLLERPFGLWNSRCSHNSMKIQAKRNFRTAMVGSGQVLLDSDKTVELKTHREKSPIKRELSIFGWISQVRVKNDRLWGESDCLNVRRSDRNRSRGVRRDRIKQNIPTLRQR